MTKTDARKTAADLNATTLRALPLEARVIKPPIANVRGSGYSVAIYDGARVVVPAQTERRPLLQILRRALATRNTAT